MDEKKEYIERGALLNRNMYGNTAPNLFCCNGRSINRMKVEFDDYCSHGERKEE